MNEWNQCDQHRISFCWLENLTRLIQYSLVGGPPVRLRDTAVAMEIPRQEKCEQFFLPASTCCQASAKPGVTNMAACGKPVVCKDRLRLHTITYYSATSASQCSKSQQMIYPRKHGSKERKSDYFFSFLFTTEKDSSFAALVAPGKTTSCGKTFQDMPHMQPC